MEELPLLQKEAVPADAEILVVAAPKTDFMDHELKMMETYLKTGGKALFLVEPMSTPTLKPFLEKFGAQWLPKKTVFETNPLQKLAAGGNPLIPVVTSYDPTHEITRDARQLSYFPIPTPIEKMAKIPSDLKVTSLFSTSNRSLEVEMMGDKVKLNEKTDRKGPLSLALAIAGTVEKKEAKVDKADKAGKSEEKVEGKTAEKKETEAPKNKEYRVVVVGDADFACNGPVRHGINGDLFQNMLSWLAQEEDLISIRPKPADTREFEITEVKTRIIHFASVILLPLIMLISGFAVWASRRRL